MQKHEAKWGLASGTARRGLELGRRDEEHASMREVSKLQAGLVLGKEATQFSGWAQARRPRGARGGGVMVGVETAIAVGCGVAIVAV